MDEFPGVTWLIGGEAGWGINLSAEVLSKTLLRMGYYVFSNIEYESLIRGGHSYYRVRFSDKPIYSHIESTDIMLALDDVTIVGDGGRHTYGHMNELFNGSILIYDDESYDLPSQILKDIGRRGVRIVGLPMNRIVKDELSDDKAKLIMRNSVGIGASAYILNLDLETLYGVVEDRFGSKRMDIIRDNIRLIDRGYDYIKDNYPSLRVGVPKPSSNKKRGLTNGNYMAIVGSIKSGMKIWVHYPMTPSTSMLNYVNQVKDRYGLIVLQPESEIAVIHIAVGAGYAGARAGVGTSGGGFALMSEAIGFAGMAEIPVVIFEVSRPGPSTGLPTRTEQGDLFEVLYPSQGRYPKCVIAPGDPEEVYRDSYIAYNIAEKYQMPVIIHYDRHLAESLYTVDIPEDLDIPIERRKISGDSDPMDNGIFQKRYADTEDGISPTFTLGEDGVTLWTGLEHDEYGIVSENPDNRVKMMNKREKKMRRLYKEMMDKKDIYKPIQRFGEGHIHIVGWGSTKGVIIDLLNHLNGIDRYRLKFIQVRWVQPFPTELFRQEIEDADKKIIIENNFDGQMERLIRQETGIEMDYSIRKYDGRPFSLDMLYKRLLEVLR